MTLNSRVSSTSKEYYIIFQWFDEKTNLLESIDVQLRKLHGSIDFLVLNRKELAVATSQFAKAAAVLSNREEHTGLARAMAQLADVEEKVNINFTVFWLAYYLRSFTR